MTSSCFKKAEPETYLIPYDYTGEVDILFNQSGKLIKYRNEYNIDTFYTTKKGTPIQYENGRRIYRIPSNGLLLTQFEENDGFIDRQYYLLSNKGKRIPIRVFEFKHFKKDSAGYVIDEFDKKGIFGDGTSGSLGNMHIYFQNFTVCTANQIDSLSSQQYERQFKDRLAKETGFTF